MGMVMKKSGFPGPDLLIAMLLLESINLTTCWYNKFCQKNAGNRLSWYEDMLPHIECIVHYRKSRKFVNTHLFFKAFTKIYFTY
jgi:hypothetical protein